VRGAMILAQVWVASLIWAGAASACGGTIAGPVVAHGWLPGHQAWFQRSCMNGPKQLLVDLDLPEPGGYDDGGGMAVPFPLPTHSLFIDAPYEGYGADHANGVTGVAVPGVTELRLGFRTGSPIFAQTTPAPPAKVRRHAYLEHLRFFVIWYPGRRGVPRVVCAVNRQLRPTTCRRHVNRPPLWVPTHQ
jgi:hypothetical protein